MHTGKRGSYHGCVKTFQNDLRKEMYYMRWILKIIDKKSSKCGRNKTGVRQNRDTRIWYFSFEPCHAPRYAVLMVPISPEIQES